MSWIKDAILLAVVVTWMFFIVVNTLRNKEIPDIVWGLPGTIFAVMIPFLLKSMGKDTPKGGSKDGDS